MSNKSTITIFGDICPVGDTLKGFESGNPTNIMSEDIIKLIQNSDLSVGNLECVFTDSPSPIRKTGPVLYAPVKCMNTLANAGFNAFSLSNNHIRDCGTSGLLSTIEACRHHNILTFGAGKNIEEAEAPLLVELNGRKVGFLSFSEHEFNYVTENRPGASTFDAYTDLNRIHKLRKEVDILIVLFHGGIEYYSYPSPLLQKKCRAMADAGADIILCQHSHCIGTYEYFGNAFILYGQGNNLFGYRANNRSWNEGLIVQIELLDNKFEIRLIPCTTNHNSILESLRGEDADSLLTEIKDRSKNLDNREFLITQWKEFCYNLENLNLPLLLGWNRYLIFLNRILKGMPVRLLYGSKKSNITNNLIRCESHYEVMRTILDKYSY